MNGSPSFASKEVLRLAIPSDGELYEPTLSFLESCGLAVERPSQRRYTARLASVPAALVLFQRTTDIALKVDEGNADMGIVGLDRFLEFHREGGDAFVVIEDLGFGDCELVLAVPDTWVDVTSTHDLANLSVEMWEKGRELRVATRYPRLVQSFLFRRGISYFGMVQASGTLEAAPAMGFADVIADITSSGVTLRENRLKTLEDGTILSSKTCLVANRRSLRDSPVRLSGARALLERVEGRLSATEVVGVTGNVKGKTAEEVARHVLTRPELAGVQGPTISPVFSRDGVSWHAVTVLVKEEKVLEAVEHLRLMGANGITVGQPQYLFQEECAAYRRLVAAIEGRAGA